MNNTNHRDWRTALTKLVHLKNRDLYPLNFYEAAQPINKPWPDHLPSDDVIKEFYTICNGGWFGGIEFRSLDQMAIYTDVWIENLQKWDARGDVLKAGQHLAFAEDSGGCPIIFDIVTKNISAFQFDGGDWEFIADNFEQFMSTLFNPTIEADDMWFEALQQLGQI